MDVKKLAVPHRDTLGCDPSWRVGNIQVMAASRNSVVSKDPSSVVTLDTPAGGEPVVVGGGGVTLMGVINRSPESISRDCYAEGPDEALMMAERYGKLGVQVIDVGGQSSSFTAPRLSAAEEMDRALPTVAALAGEGWATSVDTFHPEVAAEALRAGAVLVNDTSGLQNPQMMRLAAQTQAPFVLMYIEGPDPHNVKLRDDGAGKPQRMAARLEKRRRALAELGADKVILEAGWGINYDADKEHYARVQFEQAEHLHAFTALPVPVMYAVPRKDDRHRIPALAALAMAAGADMLRIHDVEIVSDIAWLMGRLPRPPESDRRGEGVRE